jgi:hypothetical protein
MSQHIQPDFPDRRKRGAPFKPFFRLEWDRDPWVSGSDASPWFLLKVTTSSAPQDRYNEVGFSAGEGIPARALPCP